MDIKVDGITRRNNERISFKAHTARLHILKEMNKVVKNQDLILNPMLLKLKKLKR